MNYDPTKRDSTWTMIIPGCFLDPAGRGHIFPDEIVAHLQTHYPDMGFNFGREDYDLIVNTFAAMMKERYPGVRMQFIRHDRSVA